ncbi:beta-ketoacyl synthase N-terminal-like domain-containing protein [Streptomyces sp. L2]|uniref:type I polyketide synthase n=1 Tax=Streptomyces sp. L2 TaxID=2162665 RepID=UPI001011FC45|nr:beta-ketoacyl synthase N-terminal-like domain-containing protein [Streptomyces sp. L2]
MNDFHADTDIAVIGMACRLPDANTPDEFWANLVAGVDSVRPIPVEERRSWGEDETTAADPRYVPAHGLVDGVGDFDADFFGYTPRDAAVLNPQHQIFLECAWEAMEHAGYHPADVPGPVGMYAGAGRNGYGRIVLERPDLLPGVDVMAATIANEPEHLCTQVSYRLGLTGPSVTVQTACSSSLVAIHEAGRALLAGDCDMALAGGITIRLPRVGYRHQEGGTMSPDGRCRTFSSDAKGIVAGDGAGIVVLRRLQDALDDGDTVHAVLLGSAVNNDGRERAGYTAPGMRGQTEVIRLAHMAAGVAPESIGYVEAHGTGTPVGDPIEVAALTKAFASPATRPGSIRLGAAKTNIGHTDTAAGVAGLIKATLALENQFVPGNLNFKEPNPRIDFASGPFTVPTAGADWTAAEDQPRRAGVSSFGIGGTNAHAVLQEAPRRPAMSDTWPVHILPLAARTPTALDAMAERLAAHLAGHPEQPLADVAHTLQTGRQAFPYRHFVVCADHASAVAALTTPPSAGQGTVAAAHPPVVFSLPGSDVPARELTDELAAVFPAVRAAADECAAALSGQDTDAGALFTLQYALGRLWRDWGVRPDAWRAEGAGELVVACLSGAIDLATAARLLPGQDGQKHAIDAQGHTETAGSVVVRLPETGTDGAVAALLTAAGRLWQAGTPVDWRAMACGTRRHRVPLPTYPFERRHVAIRPAAPVLAETTAIAGDERTAPAETAAPAEQPKSVAERLSALFQQVLGAGDDTADFFELGGDSLAAVQLVALIEETFGVTPPVDVVFDAPAVPDLAAVIEGLLAEAAAEAS